MLGRHHPLNCDVAGTLLVLGFSEFFRSFLLNSWIFKFFLKEVSGGIASAIVCLSLWFYGLVWPLKTHFVLRRWKQNLYLCLQLKANYFLLIVTLYTACTGCSSTWAVCTGGTKDGSANSIEAVPLNMGVACADEGATFITVHVLLPEMG